MNRNPRFLMDFLEERQLLASVAELAADLSTPLNASIEGVVQAGDAQGIQAAGIFTSNLDIGSPSPAGSSSYNSATDAYTVSGGGADIWDNSDQFQFLYRSANGDGSFVARVTAVANTNAWAKAGVMFRNTTAANSMFAMMVATPGSGVSFQWRNSTGGTCGYAQVTGITAPVWVKIVRTGNSFTGYYSKVSATPTNSDWIQVGTAQTVPMSSAVQGGLAVTSHNNGTLCSGTFTGVAYSQPSVNSAPTVSIPASSNLPAPTQGLPATPPTGYDQSGRFTAGTITDVTYYSTVAGRNLVMKVYTPPGYNSSQKYGVVYCYQGIGVDTGTIFADWGVEAGTVCDNLIGEKKISKGVIIVAVDDQFNGTYGSDVAGMTINDVIPYIDSHYSTYADADHRGIYGYSWGGGYAFNVGCANLDVFRHLSPSSSAPNKSGDGTLFPNGGAEAKQKLKTLLISCGTADSLYSASEGAHNYCVTNGIPHVWMPVSGGGHDAGSTWRPAFWNFLQLADSAGISGYSAIGDTANLSVLGADDGGESNLTYTWSTAGTAPGPVSFSVNGTNAAKNTVATFDRAGVYNFLVTIADPAGLTATSTVSVSVNFEYGAFTETSDIGSPALAGSTNFNPATGIYTIRAGGTDIWGTSDQFRFTRISNVGGGMITARVTSLTNTNTYAKAGVMFRSSTDANSAYAIVYVSPSNQAVFEYRSAAGASAASVASVAAGGSPVWVRLIRSGPNLDQFTAYYSRDNATWTPIGTPLTLNMPTTALAGLAVTSHNASSLTTAVMDNVTLAANPQRGRATLNAARTTFVADNGNLIRGPYTSTEWTNASPFTELAKLKDLGFNAVHLYAEVFDINYNGTTGTAPGYASAQVDKIVQYARDLGIYVVMTIGNGANNGNYNRLYVEDFWRFYASRYANETHVVFEVQNEPVAWGPPYSSASATPTGAVDMEISAYNIIRSYAPDAPVLLFSYAVLGGTGGGNNALTDIRAFNQAVFGTQNATWTNVAVGFHGYAGDTDTPVAVQTILDAGYPMFMTEYGGEIWGSNQHGFNVQMTAVLEDLKVSWLGFQYVPPSGVSSNITLPAVYKDRVEYSGLSWTPDYGVFPAQRGTYGNNGNPWTTTYTYSSNILTGTLRIEAEKYDTGASGVSFFDTTAGNAGGLYRADNVDIISCNDTGGGYAVSSIASGEWLNFSANVPQAGWYNLSFRYSNVTAGANIRVLARGQDVTGAVALPTTGSATTWNKITVPVLLGSGFQIIRVEFPVGGANLNWIEIAPQSPGTPVSNGTYLIINRSTGLAMQLSGSNVVQQVLSPSNTLQRWNFQSLGAGEYRIYSNNNGSNWNAWPSALNTVGWWGIGGGQVFVLKSTGDGYYNIKPMGNGLDIEPSTSSAGSTLVWNNPASRLSQQWAIISIDDQMFPSGLMAYRDAAGKAQLSWKAATGASSYIVKRSTTPGGPYVTIATGVKGTGFVDDSALAGTIYYYTVHAVGSTGKQSLGSLEASLTAAPRTHLKFDETTGTTAIDSTGAGRNGTLVNGVVRTAGAYGNAVSFDGSNDYVSLPSGVVNGLTNFTISAWVNLASNPTWSRIFDFGSSTNVNMFLTANPGNSNTLRFAVTTSGSGNEQRISGTHNIALGAWAHVAVTLSGSVGALYVNGQPIGSNPSMSLTPSSLGATSNNYLGRSQYSDPYFNGKIDDLRIYSSALSASDIASIHQVGNLPTLASAAMTNPSTPPGKTALLSVLGADSAGEAGLTYTWSVLNTPPAPVVFSANGTNASKSITATFSKTGVYNLICTITNSAGYSITSSLAINVQPAVTNVAGTSGNDYYVVKLSSDQTSLLIWNSPNTALAPTHTLPLELLSTAVIDLGAGVDTLVVDFSAGQGIPLSLANVENVQILNVASPAVNLSGSEMTVNSTVIPYAGSSIFQINAPSFSSLSLSGSARLRLGAGQAVIATGDVQSLRQGLHNGAVGATPSISSVNTMVTLALLDNSRLRLTSFAGQSMSAPFSQILIQSAAAGDANLDGAVNQQDLLVIYANLGAANAGWLNGDMDQDGVVDFADVALVQSQIAASSSSSSVLSIEKSVKTKTQKPMAKRKPQKQKKHKAR